MSTKKLSTKKLSTKINYAALNKFHQDLNTNEPFTPGGSSTPGDKSTQINNCFQFKNLSPQPSRDCPPPPIHFLSFFCPSCATSNTISYSSTSAIRFFCSSSLCSWNLSQPYLLFCVPTSTSSSLNSNSEEDPQERTRRERHTPTRGYFVEFGGEGDGAALGFCLCPSLQALHLRERGQPPLCPVLEILSLGPRVQAESP